MQHWLKVQSGDSKLRGTEATKGYFFQDFMATMQWVKLIGKDS